MMWHEEHRCNRRRSICGRRMFWFPSFHPSKIPVRRSLSSVCHVQCFGLFAAFPGLNFCFQFLVFFLRSFFCVLKDCSFLWSFLFVSTAKKRWIQFSQEIEFRNRISCEIEFRDRISREIEFRAR
jgi:hypothetical protein